MLQAISTQDIEPRRRLAFWTDMVCSTYVQLECEPNAGAGHIEGSIASTSLGNLRLSTVDSTAQWVRRTTERIGRASEDYFLVSIQAAGQCVVSQDGRDALLTPGDYALYDSTRPYSLRFDDAFRQFVLMLPGRGLRTSVNQTECLTATTVSGKHGAGRLMTHMIRTLADDMGTLAPASSAAVADSVSQILLAGLLALPAAHRQPIPRLHTYHRERIKAHVMLHLREPGLTVAGIAAQLQLSTSSLHRIWAGEPCSLADWIWSQRLDAAHRDVCDPCLAANSLSQIAFGWGFSDAAHFSRAFRARFGSSPRELRRSASNIPTTSTPRQHQKRS